MGVAAAVLIFFMAQIIVGLLLSLYPALMGWSDQRSTAWLNDSLTVKIVYLFLVATFIIVALRYFFQAYKVGFDSIGLRRPKGSDLAYSLAAFPFYLVTLVVVAAIAKALFPELNLNQEQQLGFDGVYNGGQLILIGIALVVLAPITEEIIFRGLLYGSLKKAMPLLYAAVFTSVLFAIGHLPEGGAEGPLYIAAIDTFVLSMILVYLREKTGGLWASISLHSIKNAIAFTVVFVLQAA